MVTVTKWLKNARATQNKQTLCNSLGVAARVVSLAVQTIMVTRDMALDIQYSAHDLVPAQV
jgi:hypothetical protein